ALVRFVLLTTFTTGCHTDCYPGTWLKNHAPRSPRIAPINGLSMANQGAMLVPRGPCVCISVLIYFPKLRPGARPDLLSCSRRGAASLGQCSATGEFARASPQNSGRCLPASSV